MITDPEKDRLFSLELRAASEQRKDGDQGSHSGGSFSRRWASFLLVFALLCAATVGFTFSRHRLYEAQAKIVIGANAGSSPAEGVKTEAEVINSTQLIRSAFEQLTPKERRDGFKPKDDATVPHWSYTVGVLKDTSVIAITARSYKPELAARFANDIAEAYFRQSADQSSKSASKGLAFVGSALTTLKDQLYKSTAKLESYQKSSGLVDPTSQMGAAAQQISELRTSKEQAEADLKATSAKIDSIKKQLSASQSTATLSQSINGNPEFTKIRNHLADLRSQLAEKSKEYAPNSSQIQTLNQQIQDAENSLKSVVQSSVSEADRQQNPAVESLLLSYANTVTDDIANAEKLKASETALTQHEAELKSYPKAERTFSELKRQADEYSRTLGMLTDKYYDLLIAQQSGGPKAQLTQKAEAPAEPISPNIRLYLGVGFGLSLLFALVVMVTAEWMDTRIHEPEAAEKLCNAPILTAIPSATSLEKGSRPLIGQVKETHAFMESFRLLRNSIEFASPGLPIRRFAITSPTKGEGKTTVSLNLALSFAMDGKKVLLMECDLRRPSVAAALGIPNETGLTNVIAGKASMEMAIFPTAHENLFGMGSGPLPSHPTELLNSGEARDLVDELAKIYDVIVMDGPPCMGLADFQVISTIADGVAVVVALESTRKPHLRATMSLLKQVHAPLLGVILNKVDFRRRSRGRNGSYYFANYYNHYQPDGADNNNKA